MSERRRGTIKVVRADKGYGFLTSDDGADSFFHASQCREFDLLRTGVRVSFLIQDAPKGPRACDVQAL